VAVSLSVANHHASLPVAYRLYLPKEWAEDSARREKAGVPEDIVFKTKLEIALDQLRWACEAGLARGVVLMDVAYGCDAKLRMSATALGLIYAAGVKSDMLVWAPGIEPPRGRKAVMRRPGEPYLISARELALGLPAKAWRTIRWREGAADWLSSRFARTRVSRCPSSRPRRRKIERRVAVDRVARGREGADQILAVDPSRRHLFAKARRHHQTALAHRA